MKSEERHRLQENELERVGQQAKAWFEQHGMKVLIGVCAVAIVAAIAFYAMRSMEASSARGWAELRTAMLADQQSDYPTELLTVWRNYPNAPVGAWAVLHSAELRLQRFSFQQFEDRGQSDLELSNDDPQAPGVVEQFRAALTHPASPDDVQERALYGLATTLEILSDGSKEKTEEVIDVYQRLLDRFGDGVYAPIATRRIEQLEQEGTTEFYAWFRDQNPNPDDEIDRGPTDGFGGTLPAIPSDLRLKPELATSDTETTEPSGPALVAPGSGDSEPGGEDPAGDDETTPDTEGGEPSGSETPAPESSDSESP